MGPERVVTEVDGRQLTVGNLDKVLYPATGTTKAEVLHYVSEAAPALLPHVRDRPMTFVRAPEGPAGPTFFAKNAPEPTPGWVRTVTLPAPGSAQARESIRYVVVDDRPTLVWATNLAALELHVPQWRLLPGRDGPAAVGPVDLLVLDLDPGPPADVVACCAVALALRDQLALLGLTAYPRTSGSKGMQLAVPVEPTSDEATSSFAKRLAEGLEAAWPELVVSRMTKSLRPGKVLVDWSQNRAVKTTVAPYSLRVREQPTVATPVSWDEVASCRRAEDLTFTLTDVLDRLQDVGDLAAPLATGEGRAPLPTLPHGYGGGRT